GRSHRQRPQVADARRAAVATGLRRPEAWRLRLLRAERQVTRPMAVTIERAEWTAWPVVVHSLRTAVACVASLLVARLFRLPEGYWAPVTAMVITQSSLGAALAVSWHRFIGTFLGAAVGATVATYLGPHALAFGAGLVILGILRLVTHSDLTGYRFGGVAL